MRGVNPYVQYNRENIGIGVGFNLGNFSQVISVNEFEPTSMRKLNFYPSFSFRAGKLNDLFFEYRFSNQFPTGFPALTHQFGFGVKMGKRGGVLRMGTASTSSFYISPNITIGGHLILEPYLGLGSGIFASGESNSGGIASIGVHYKFNKKQN